jgi:hypothetical protein
VGGLTDRAGGGDPSGKDKIAQAHEAWQESMSRRIDQVREEIRQRNLNHLALYTGAELDGDSIIFNYWDRQVSITWPDLGAHYLPELEPCSIFDLGMLLYYLHTADGIDLADRWIGFRELPDGAFYNQAFQGYSGKLVARQFGEDLESFHAAAHRLGGFELTALAPAAHSFIPLPRIRLALAMWPGDDDFPSRATVLFDAHAGHYMTTDGLALLGSGLARRVIRAGAAE